MNTPQPQPAEAHGIRAGNRFPHGVILALQNSFICWNVGQANPLINKPDKPLVKSPEKFVRSPPPTPLQAKAYELLNLLPVAGN